VLDSFQPAVTNTRSAPRRHAPRRPWCLLCSAPCSFRLKNDAAACASVVTLARSLRYFLRPLFPSFGIAPSPVANVPTEAAGNEDTSFPFRNR